MGNTVSFRFSPEARALLRDHTDFFAPLVEVDLRGAESLRLSGKDPEAHTEVQTLPNGDREVTWVYPLDDNLDAADGRLYLRDTFVFDASERLLKDFTRELRASGGAGKKWETYLDLYRREIQKRAWSATDPFVQTFALGVAEAYSRGLLPDAAGARQAFTAALYRQADYLHRAADAARRWQPTWKIRSGDSENRYYLISRVDSVELHLVLAVDEDSDSANGRVYLHEKFVLDAVTRALKFHERLWESDPQNPGKDSASWLKALNRKKPPSFAEAESFLKDLLPELWPQSEPDPLAALRLMGKLGLKKAGGFPPRKSPDSELAARKSDIFDSMRDVALESLAHRAESSRGWGRWGGALDELGERARLESIFRKAKLILAEVPKLFPLQALSRLSLPQEEAQLRDRLVRDPLLQELDDLSREGDGSIRASSLAKFARHRLMEERGMFRAAVDLAQGIKNQPQGRREAESILAIAEGRGTFGQKFDFVLPRFSGEVTKPAMLLAMAAAPVFGVAVELGGLKLAQGALGLEKIGELGRSATFGAELLGMSGEAFGFTVTHRAAERWSSGSEGFWRGAGDEMLGAMLMFGGLRLASGAGSWASRNFLKAQSSRGVKGLVGAIRPAASLAAMTASGYLSRRLGWAPPNFQGFGGNLFDAALLFLQSEVGFRLANAATGGGLRNFAGEIKMRLGVSKGSALFGGDAAGPVLVEPSRIPSLRLFDLNQGGLTTDFFVGPGREAHLDPILFGNEGAKIRLFRDAQGNIFLEDRRERVFSWAPDPARKMNFREQSLLFNGVMLPTYHPVRLVPGDVLFFPIRKLKVALPAQSPVFQALAELPESAQRALAEGLSMTRTWNDFFGTLEKYKNASVATIQAEMAKVVEGETPLFSLPIELGLLPKIQELMEADFARWAREGLLEEFYSLQPKRRDSRWSPQEQAYQTLRAAEALRDRIRQSRSVEEIRDHLLNSRLAKIEDIPLSELIGRVLNIFSNFREGAQHLPYASGLRQRIRDILEERVFRDYETYLRSDGTIPLPQDAELRGEYSRLDQKRFEIFAKLRHGVSPDDPDALFSPQELEERLYQVLERGKSLSLLPRAGQARRDAENYQGMAIGSARHLFAGEMGPEIDEGSREFAYRRALQTLNRHARRPVAGMPSREEIDSLHRLVIRHLEPQAAPDFPSLIERLRRHWDEATPQIRELLEDASSEGKSLLLSNYFGGYPSRDLNPASAFQVALWMGQFGMPREIAMIYESAQGTLRATLAAEEGVRKSRDRQEDFFILRNLVGARDQGGDGSRDIELLPTFEDLRFATEQAEQYWRRGFPQRLGETPLYEPSQRLFRNWLVHPSAVSELRLSLGDSGQTTEIQVRFGLRPGTEPGGENKDAEGARLEVMGKELGIPVTVVETSYDRLLEGLPFPIQSKTP